MRRFDSAGICITHLMHAERTLTMPTQTQSVTGFDVSTLRAELDSAREQTDRLFRMISPEALYERPVSERHRLIFYLGHLDAFDWNLLARRALGERAFQPGFDSLFERGIDPEPGKEPHDRPSDWPRRAEIDAYNAKTRDCIDANLSNVEPDVLQMAIEHRLMHAETLAYLIHNLPYSEKCGPAPRTSDQFTPLQNPMLCVEEGIAELGNAVGFGWDNEFRAHVQAVPAFSMSRYKISNAEWLEFVKEGGTPSNFWIRQDGQWFWRGMFGLLPLPLDWPVWVTWNQARAYAEWKGLALPSEAQWHRAQASQQASPVRDNFGFNSWEPVAVNTSAAPGPQQLTGNGWEWTGDAFAPFDGFKPHPYYPGYSADFFDGRHYVLKGASPRTATLMSRPSFRNWFRPEYPYLYAGFRLVGKS